MLKIRPIKKKKSFTNSYIRLVQLIWLKISIRLWKVCIIYKQDYVLDLEGHNNKMQLPKEGELALV